ncbi:MAG: TatD family hydrolase [Anaerolineales bacterium]
MLTDTHCHLDLDHFDADRDAVMTRAWEVGVERILIPALDVDSCRRVLALAEMDSRLFAAIGVHPNSAKTWDDNTLNTLRQLAAHPKVVAIGEIGLDYYWDFAPKELQLPVLHAQLALAAELRLPVVIHNRDSTEDILAVLVAWQAELVATGNPLASRPGVLHSYSGDVEAAQKALAANFLLGVTGPVTFKNAATLQDWVKSWPLDKLLIETDAPYLTPHPNRGKRNEPAFVKWVAEKIAHLKGVAYQDVIQQTGKNAGRLFGW